MSLRSLSGFALAVSACLSANLAHADGLKGTTVSGSLSSLNSGITVSNQFTSPTVVGGGNDFSGNLKDSIGDTFAIAVNFTNAGALTVDVTSTRNPSTAESAGAGNLFGLSFSDAAFDNTVFSLTGYGCNSNLSNACNVQDPASGLTSDTLSGSTLTLNFDNLAPGQVYTFAEQPASVTPEPSSIALLGTGLAGIGGVLRRRRVA